MNKTRRNTGAGMGIGTAAAIIGASVARSQGIEIDEATATATGSLFTALFGWVGSLFQ
tara:strand:+ start:555 stop:728 length:174 start_codon:yes stop_codon:yes gene_type:complete